MSLPDGFMWGVSTSAYQVEGAVDEDGRGPSIWDTFAHTPGKIDGGGTGDVACDHYHRWREDVELMAELGVNAYRFSIAWPRVFPTGGGPLERRGLAHYDRLIDELLDRGIEPVVTLYHWDLPQALQDEGGWLARDMIDRFAVYPPTCFDAYGDRVKRWLTINEPWIVGLLGYLHGLHAPGLEDDVRGEATCFHHLLLAHGRAVQELRASGRDGDIGIALSLAPHYPLTGSPADAEAAWASDGYVNRWFLDPVHKGAYPEDMRGRYEELLGELDFVRVGDLGTMASPSDFRRELLLAARDPGSARPQALPVGSRRPRRHRAHGSRHGSHAGHLHGPARAASRRLRRADPDHRERRGVRRRAGARRARARRRRMQFVKDHVVAVQHAIERGVKVLGYCYWSLLDNFEWALGYAQRFGLVYVDYERQRRTIKDSGRYYARVVRTTEVVP
jgi:beta-glucosidase